MSTRFVSKNSNYQLVLKHGIPGSIITGQQPTPGLYIKFQDGIVEVKDDAIADKIRNHPSFNIDFVEVSDIKSEDPYAYNREEIEPAHVITEMKYGHVEKTIGSPRKVKMSPEMKKVIEREAIKMIPGILKANPKILKDILTSLAGEAAKTSPAKEKEDVADEGDKK